MKASDQGVENPDYQPYTVIPRTLVFVTSNNPTTDSHELLLLRGAADKRLWPNRYNGLGGHVEPGEDVHRAARREVMEEAGLAIDELTLRAVISIDADDRQALAHEDRRPGVMVFVFHATTSNRSVIATEEGAPEWVAEHELYQLPLVDDLYELLPRIMNNERLVYGAYRPDTDGKMNYVFST